MTDQKCPKCGKGISMTALLECKHAPKDCPYWDEALRDKRAEVQEAIREGEHRGKMADILAMVTTVAKDMFQQEGIAEWQKSATPEKQKQLETAIFSSAAVWVIKRITDEQSAEANRQGWRNVWIGVVVGGFFGALLGALLSRALFLWLGW